MWPRYMLLLFLWSFDFWDFDWVLLLPAPPPCFFFFQDVYFSVPWSNIFLPSCFLRVYMSALYIFAWKHSELKVGAKVFIPVSMTAPARKWIVLDTKQKALLCELSASSHLIYNCQVHPLLCVSSTHWSACPQKGITYVVESKLAYTLSGPTC